MILNVYLLPIELSPFMGIMMNEKKETKIKQTPKLTRNKNYMSYSRNNLMKPL